MPYHKSCKKALRVADRRHERNTSARSELKTAMKSVLSLTAKKGSEEILRSSLSVIDKSVKYGIIHRKNASNKKSRLMRFVNKLK